jgi:hypothetical protein
MLALQARAGDGIAKNEAWGADALKQLCAAGYAPSCEAAKGTAARK